MPLRPTTMEMRPVVTSASGWAAVRSWAFALSKHPAPQNIPYITDARDGLAAIIAGGEQGQAAAAQLQNAAPDAIAPILLGLHGTPIADYLDRALEMSWVIYLATETGNIRADAEELARRATEAVPREVSPRDDTSTAKRSLFFITSEGEYLTWPEQVFLAPRGLPSSLWNRIIEACYRERVGIFIENKRTGRNAFYLPGHSSLADLMMLTAEAGDPVEVLFRYTDDGDGEECPHCVERMTRLAEATARVLEGGLSLWEESEASIQIAEGVVQSCRREKLSPNEVVALCREIQQAHDAVIILETPNKPNGQTITLRSGQTAANRARLATFRLHRGDYVKIRVIATASQFLCHRIMATYLDEKAPTAGLTERAIQFTTSKMETVTLGLEIRERLERRERQEMGVLIRLQTGEILLYGDLETTPLDDMKRLWQLTLGREEPIVEAHLSLGTQQFQITRAGGNAQLSRDQLEKGRDLLLEQLVARRVEPSIPRDAKIDGPSGYYFGFGVDHVKPAEAPFSEEMRGKIVEALVAPVVVPPPPLPDLGGGVDTTSYDPAWQEAYIASLATGNDPRLRFVEGDLDEVWIASSRMTSFPSLPVLFSVDRKSLIMGEFDLPFQPFTLPVLHRHWKANIPLFTQYSDTTRYLRRRLIPCSIARKNDLYRVILHFQTLEDEPLRDEGKRVAIRAMRRFLAQQKIPNRIELQSAEKVVLVQTKPWWQELLASLPTLRIRFGGVG